MKLSEIKGEKAIEVLGDLIEPSSEILTDEKVKKAFEGENRILDVLKIILKDHSSAVMQILATLDGVPIEEYECNVLSLPSKVLEILNDPDLQELFPSQVQTTDATSSTSVSTNTKEN